MRFVNAGRGGQRGVGLIEVLIALLVLSIGFLAAGGMQLRALGDNRLAYHESQARLLLDDMMDRMRNNPRGVAAGAYDGRDTASLDGDGPDCRAAGCDPVTLARHDLFAWRDAIAPESTLPRLPPFADGSAAIGTIAVPVDGVYVLTLAWETRVDGEPVAHSVGARFVP